VRIARTHDRTAVLEDLDIVHERQGAQFAVLGRPQVHDSAHPGVIHLGERQAVVRGIADHPAETTFAFGDEQTALIHAPWRRVRQQGHKVVVEDKDAPVIRVAGAV